MDILVIDCTFGKSINEFIALKTLSITEVKYKLLSKGIKTDLIEEYIQDNIDELNEYEKKCVIKIINKKCHAMNQIEIKAYLKKKGYKEENISMDSF